MRFSVSMIRCLLALSVCCAVAQAQKANELIFPIGSTNFSSSHASTVVELKNSKVMSAWFGGSWEGRPDVAIWGATRDDAGWSKPVEIVREAGVPCYNPVLFYTHDGKLWLYYKFGPSPTSWSAGRMSSTDNGQTWSAPEHLPAGLLGPIRTKPLVEADGTIVSGSSIESYRTWAVWIERSTDNGKTWAKIGPVVPPMDLDAKGYGDGKNPAPDVPGSTDWKFIQGIIQPTVIQMSGKHLRLFARSTAKTARVTIADSFDNGLTWTEAKPLDVPNPNSGIDVVKLKDGRMVMIYNDTTTGRTPLNLGVSTDGEHFKMFKTLESEPGEYSYPAIVEAANGDLLMTYTFNRKDIKYVRMALSDVPR